MSLDQICFRINALKASLQNHKDITLDWEIRSRIAYIPKASLDRLSKKGFKYLPRLLSTWAVENELSPAPSLIQGVGDDGLDDIISKAQVLQRDGLDADARAVWNAVDQEARNVMITMWLTREPHSRSAIAHPIPTAGEALEIIDSLNLSAQAKGLAKTIVRIGVDEKGAALFTQ